MKIPRSHLAPPCWQFAALLLAFSAVCSHAAPAKTKPAKMKIDTTKPTQKPTAKIQYAVKDEAEFFNALDLSRPDMAAVKSAVAAKNWEAAKAAWAKHLETRDSPQWIWSYRDRASIVKTLDEQFDGLKGSIPSADRTLARQFSSQGSSATLDKRPDWLHNGGEWANVLNRFNFLRPMGEAYWATGDEKYANDAAFLLNDWIARNPIPEELGATVGTKGTAWRTLETGIRLQNWFEALQFFMNAPSFDADTKYQISRSLAEHARRLYQHESRYRSGNWQVVESSGLSEAGIMLPEFKEAAQWRQRGFQYMVEHMQKDVFADGAHYELAPGYHKWVMNQFLQVALLAKKNGYEVPSLLDRHEKMYEFLVKTSLPDGEAPSVNDSHDQTIANDMGIGALLYNRADFRYFGPDKAQAAWVWNFGPDVAARYANLNSKLPDYTSTLMPNAKYGIMRSGWGKDDNYLLFDMAPWGGAHSHADRLQVLLYTGRDLIIDASQYSYDLPLSKYFKTAPAHNVLLIDGNKQIEANPKVVTWQDKPEAILAAGSIEDKAFRHQRSVLWMKSGYYVIADFVTPLAAAKAGPHEITRLFHFPVGAATGENNTAQTMFADGENVQIQNVGAGNLQMREDWIAVSGAKAEKAPVAAFVNQGGLPMVLVTVLTPFGDKNELPKVENLPGDGSQAHLRVSFDNGQSDEIVIAPKPTNLKIGGKSVKGQAMIARDGAKSGVIAFD